MKVTRAYRLRLYPNAAKAESLRYTAWWYRQLALDYCKRLGRKCQDSFESTAGLGSLANQAQTRARAILRAGRAASKATGQRFVIPDSLPLMCEAEVRAAKHGDFDYWIKAPLGPWIPAVSHQALNSALRLGGTVRPRCQIMLRRDVWYAYVFVAYEVAQPALTNDYLGLDVGINAGVARSDGYIGRSLRPAMARARARRAEQSRQGHRRSSKRTAVKQILDREVRRVVTLAARCGNTLVVESPKTLANLKPSGSIGGWARRHFGERVRQIAEISGVPVRSAWPAFTSITCLRCHYSDKTNRRGVDFKCVRCGARGHADVVAARNLTRRARGDWNPTNLSGWLRIDKAALQTQAGVWA